MLCTVLFLLNTLTKVDFFDIILVDDLKGVIMREFNEISPQEIENAIKLIGTDWMLITASDGEKVNTMTASWGCLGVLWNKNVCIAFIRPQRYTYEFAEKASHMSFSFFTEEYREALRFCGTKSGRDFDKFSETGLSVSYDGDVPIIDQAKLVLVCKKLYSDDLKKENFIIPELLKNYEKKDFHRFYICEIEKVLTK